MSAEIKIKTNRIYFEQFEAPAGEPETSEIKRAWEVAIYKVIEEAGFDAEVEISVGHDPAVQKYVTVEVAHGGGCEAGEAECDCGFEKELGGIITIAERYGNSIADQAIEAGYEAAAAQSEEFVKASESQES